MKDDKDRKEKKLLEAMQLVDERYIEEADPTKKPKVITWLGKKSVKYAALAACVCCLIIGAIWLFAPIRTPKTDTSKHRDSDYYEIIEKLADYYHKDPEHANRWEQLMDSLVNGGIKEEGNDMEAVPEAPTPDGEQTYEEVTDNQVAGVTEGDRIKRSDRHIYYLRENTLYVYSIEGEDSKCLATFEIPTEHMFMPYYQSWELFLSKDCKTVTVLAGGAPVHEKDENRSIPSVVTLYSLDVTNPTTIRIKNKVTVSGDYMTARIVDDELLLITRYETYRQIDYSNVSTFVPSIDLGNGMECISADDIYVPDTLSNGYYTVICKFDQETLALLGKKALLSFYEEAYITMDTIYATRNYQEKKDNAYLSYTEIVAVPYDEEKLEIQGSTSVEGEVRDRFSMDEYGGMLRVVTMTRVSEERRNGWTVSLNLVWDKTNANLYVIDLSTWETVATVEHFAPAGETVQSVRFDKENAYVCTVMKPTLSDPVFFFDLSDINNITYKDTGTIEGFSSSLINFGEGFLLGIGVGDEWNTVKIEVYAETESKVVSVCSYEIPHARYSRNYKSYYINRDLSLLGLGIDQGSDVARYLLLFFDGTALHEQLFTPLGGDVEQHRAVWIDGYMYMFGADAFKVEHVGGTAVSR